MTKWCGISFCEVKVIIGASYNVIISEWLVEVATKVCMDDFQEMAVPPCKYMYPEEL